MEKTALTILKNQKFEQMTSLKKKGQKRKKITRTLKTRFKRSIFLRRKSKIFGKLFSKLAFQKNVLSFDDSSLLTKWKIKKFFSIKKHRSHIQLKKRTTLRSLRHNFRSKLSFLFFQPWKKLKPTLTPKQQWLTVSYNRFQKLRPHDRIDFFRTYIGQVLLSAELHSQPDYKDSWFAVNRLFRQTEDQSKVYENTRISKEQMVREMVMLQKKSWWYDNLIQKQPWPLSEKKFRLDRPNTAFQLHWKQQKKEPWKDSLLFKRALYEGFGERLRKENRWQDLKIKPYLRRKNPRREKRNRLYHRNSILLENFRQKFRIRANKVARIKQITGKILRPFYGNLRKKQMNNILKKSRTRKSNYLTHNEMILTHFENRLDVVVYRLNLAPTILWARRLILNGSVFINNPHDAKFWDSMYSSLKKFAFPLKLRDPYHLYDKKLWTNFSKQWTKFKFLGQPKRKISYLVQPGDIIQCATGVSSNQFKTKSWLWQKPIPSHLMTHKKKTFIWHWRFQKYVHKTVNTWEENSQTTTSAIMLHMPQFRDLNSKDRVQESFLRWTIL